MGNRTDGDRCSQQQQPKQQPPPQRHPSHSIETGFAVENQRATVSGSVAENGNVFA